MKATTKAAKTITAPAIFRICDKGSHNCIGYGVPSNSEPGKTYFVSWSYSRHQYECTCQAGQHGKPCCHVAAVQEVVLARKQLAATTRLVAFFEALAQFAQQATAKQAVAEAEQVVEEPPQRYCESCSCVGKLESIDGLLLCPTCAEATRAAISEPPAPVAVATRTPAIAVKTAQPTLTNKGNTPLGTGGSFRMVNGIPMR